MLKLAQLWNFDQQRAKVVALWKTLGDLEPQAEVVGAISGLMALFALELQQVDVKIVELNLQARGGDQRGVLDGQ